MRKSIPIMVRCFACGQWFEARHLFKKYCSPHCSRVGKSRKDAIWRQAHTDPEAKNRGTFTCPYCGKTVERQTTNQATCYDPTCQKDHERKCKREKKQWGYESKKIKAEPNGHAGYCPCLQCENPFYSPDKRYIRVCAKCRPNHEERQAEYRFATYDGASL